MLIHNLLCYYYIHKFVLKAVNVCTIFILYTIKLLLKNITKEVLTAPYERLVKQLFRNVHNLVLTAPYERLMKRLFTNVHKLVLTAPYERVVLADKLVQTPLSGYTMYCKLQ